MTDVVKVAIDTQLSGEAAIAKVRELLPAFRSGMLVTHAVNPSIGREHSIRPMALQGDTRTFGGALWFFAHEAEPQDGKRSTTTHGPLAPSRATTISGYLHLFGEASVVRRSRRMHELYTPLVRTWFPDGLDDPHLTLIRFDAHGGSFWDSPAGLLQVLGAFTKSVGIGKPGKGGESGTLSCSSCVIWSRRQAIPTSTGAICRLNRAASGSGSANSIGGGWNPVDPVQPGELRAQQHDLRRVVHP